MEARKSSGNEALSVDIGAIQQKTHMEYDDIQADAIRIAATAKVMVLTGGPGTGKTTTTHGVISVYKAYGLKREITEMIDTEIRTREKLVELVNEIGFLPFFSGRIEGFSLEENISYDAWYQGRWSGKIHWDAWDWKGQVLQNKELVYGKFFEKKAGFISLKLWPDFCNYRRDGYDFDARFDDGLASYKDKGVVDYITDAGATLTRDIKDNLNYKKDGNKGFETVITRLQMKTYVVPVNYEYSKRKNGDEYGWGNCRYDIAENFWGDKLCRSAYKRSPEESLKRIIKHIKKALPKLDEDELKALLKG